MHVGQAKDVIINASAETDLQELSAALEILTSQISKHSLCRDTYRVLVRALIDKVSPRISSCSTSEGEKVSKSFDAVLLNGHPSIAFHEMCAALVLRNETSEVMARTLLLFVNEPLGGVNRMHAVLLSADVCDNVTNLVHLPTRILNALHSEATEAFDTASILQESQYFATLAEAVCLQPNVSDPARDQTLCELIGRAVRMKQAGNMVNRWLREKNSNRIVSVFQRAPQSAIQPLMKALLDAKCRSRLERRRLRNVLKVLMEESRAIREICVSKMPFERPLFRRPRAALSRLATAVAESSDEAHKSEALNIAAERWSAEDFSLGADVQLQRQVTRLLLYYLRTLANRSASFEDYGESSLMLILVEGVHLRLKENDIRLRRHGMVVGEASSRYCNEEDLLAFSREGLLKLRMDEKKYVGDEEFEDGGDSDFSELAAGVGNVSLHSFSSSSETDSIDDVKILNNSTASGEVGTATPESSRFNIDDLKGISICSDAEEKNARWRGTSFWADINTNTDVWDLDDGRASVASYELTSSSDDDDDDDDGKLSHNAFRNGRDYEAVRKRISAPLSVPRLLGLFRDANQTGGGGLKVDGETLGAALRTLSRRAEASYTQRHTTLHACVVDLMLEVVHVDVGRYPDELVPLLREARAEALQRLLEMDISSCGVALVEKIICGPTSDVGKRSECMGALSAGVRGAQKRAARVMAERVQEEEREAQARANRNKVNMVGTVTRRVTSSVRPAPGGRREVRLSQAWDDEGLARVFDALANRLCAGGGADFVQLSGRDNRLWAQGLVTLAVLSAAGGVSAEGIGMRAAVMEIVVERVLDGEEGADAVVRRGCALALGSVAETMTEAEIEGSVRGGGGGGDSTVQGAAQWMERAARGDSDVGVRRFAARSLRMWAGRVEGLSVYREKAAEQIVWRV